MSRLLRSIIALPAALLLVPASIGAQSPLTDHTFRLEESESAAVLDLNAASWLVGSWAGTGFGGMVEEVWLPPAHGQMIGLFRYHGEDDAGFSEIMALGERDAGTLLQVKHFSPDFEGWEARDESVDFRFIRADADALYFSGLTLRHAEGDRLRIFIAMRGSDGTTRERVLEYDRVQARPADAAASLDAGVRHHRFLTRGGTWWRTSNETYQADSPDEPDAFGMVYRSLPGGQAVEGCLWSERDGAPAGVAWHFFTAWDPGRDAWLAHQTSPSGASGSGLEWFVGNVGEMVQTFRWGDGSETVVRHLGTAEDEHTLRTRSFDKAAEGWQPRRDYTWARQTGESPVVCRPA